MVLALHFYSNSKTVRSGTSQDIKDFNSLSVYRQSQKGELIVSMMLCTEESYEIFGDDIVELSIKNETLESENN